MGIKSFTCPNGHRWHDANDGNRCPVCGVDVAETIGDAKAEHESTRASRDGPENTVSSAIELSEFGRYRVIEELGRGGMGIVYRALDPVHHREVALKTLPNTDAKSLSRFKREFRVLAEVDHPNVVKLLELTSDGGTWFYTMEVVEGVDLLSYVEHGFSPTAENSQRATDECDPQRTQARSTSQMSEGKMKRLRDGFAQLAGAIATLHERGVVHRDVKPSNVIVTPGGRVVLLDFGLVAQTDSAGIYQSVHQGVLGTAAYMSPEQAACEPVSTASDWYSLGVMLYQALTDRLPFSGNAIDISNHEDVVRYRVAAGLGKVLMLRGRYPEAESQFRAALRLTTDPLAKAQTESEFAELAFKTGDMKTAIDATERALRMIGNRVPTWRVVFLLRLVWETVVQVLHTFLPRLFLSRTKAHVDERQLIAIRLHNRLTYCYWFGKDKVSCLWTHLRGMNLAERHPPTVELAQAYSLHAPVMSLIPYISRGVEYARKSFEIYQEQGDLWGQGQSQNFWGMVLFVGARFDEGLEKFREAEHMLGRTGDIWEVNMARTWITNSLHRKGDLIPAKELAKRVHLAGLDLGDFQATAITLDVWSRASGGQVDPAILQTELQRPRADVQVSAQIMLADGVRLLMLDQAEEAAIVFENGDQIAKRAGIKNAWTVPLHAWLASALRRQAEKTSKSEPSRTMALRRASKLANKALRVARKFQNDLPHALREAGLISAMQGSERRARRYLDESLEVAERQGAKFEHAQTLLARGRVGLTLDWPGAAAEVATAQEALRGLGADFALAHYAAPE